MHTVYMKCGRMSTTDEVGLRNMAMFQMMMAQRLNIHLNIFPPLNSMKNAKN